MLYNIFVGVILGAGLIFPGISGGVLAVIMGVYEEMIYVLNNFFKNIKENMLFLFPIIIGMLIGVFAFGKLLKFLFNEYYFQTCYAFMGLILGGVPLLIKKSLIKGRTNGIAFILSFIFSLLFFVLGKNKIDFSISLNGNFESMIRLFITGFVYVSGKVIPGISSSFMLMLLGMYDYVLTIITNPLRIFTSRLFEIIPLILGMIAGFIVFVRVMITALKRWYSTTYSIIIGFVIGSLPATYPGFLFNIREIISIIIFIIGLTISYSFSLLKQKE